MEPCKCRRHGKKINAYMKRYLQLPEKKKVLTCDHALFCLFFISPAVKKERLIAFFF